MNNSKLIVFYDRVFGVNGLRVVDASVLQVRYLSINHVTVQAVAELASEMIIDHWRKPGQYKEQFHEIENEDSEVNNFIRRSIFKRNRFD